MRRIIATALLGLCGCALAGRPPPGAPPLGDEGELHVYLAPVPHPDRRLTFTVSELSAVREGGESVPLTLRLPQISPAALARDERLLATGRLPRGRYSALRLVLEKASVEGDDGAPARLLDAEPTTVEVPLEVARGQAVLLRFALDPERSIRDGFAFAPEVSAAIPPRTSPALAGACTSAAADGLTIFDTQTRELGGAVATGLAPRGLALDPVGNRAYVALGGEDQVEVIDLALGTTVGKIPVRGGDEPRALLLLADRRTLLVVNHRSQTVAFLDAVAGQELGRVPVGEGPHAIVQQRGVNRAFVVNRRSSSLTVVDLGARQAIGSVATDPEPLFAQVSRDGSRLYVVHAGSLFMFEYALPSMELLRRIRVGLGVTALKLDARTDLIYVAHAQDGRLEVYDASSALPVDEFELPGPVSHLAIDDLQNQLFAVVPSLRAIAVIDLTSRGVVGVIEPPGEPWEVRLAAERN